MDENRNKIIVGAIVGVIVIGVIVLIATRSSVSCDLVDAKPVNVDLTKLENMKTEDNTAMANFAGYLIYSKPEDKSEKPKIFLPLEFKSININKVDDQKSILNLETNCAKIALSYKIEAPGRTVDTITINLSEANGDSVSCTVDNPNIVVTTLNDKHYKCTTEKSYTCSTKTNKDGKDITTKVATLVVSALEFELEGKPEEIKEGKFSTKFDACKA